MNSDDPPKDPGVPFPHSPEWKLYLEVGEEAWERTALLAGYPAFLRGYTELPLLAIDTKYGLPVATESDFKVGSHIDTVWARERATLGFVRDFGLPWNSRLPHLDILKDPEGYFRRQPPDAVSHLEVGRPTQVLGWEESLTLTLQPKGRIRYETDSMFLDPVSDPRKAHPFLRNPRPRLRPTLRDLPYLLGLKLEKPLKPCFTPGFKENYASIYEEAKSAAFVAGPPGSHLLFFHFSGFERNMFGYLPKNGETFAAFDTQLFNWLPSYLLDNGPAYGHG